MNGQQCDTCRFWRGQPGQPEGSCKRYPPQPDLLQLAADIKTYDFSSDRFAGEGAFYWVQPCTDREDWCGEWVAAQPDAPLTDDLLERLAREAGFYLGKGESHEGYEPQLARFAALVAEECAKECDAVSAEHSDQSDAIVAAERIRKRFKP